MFLFDIFSPELIKIGLEAEDKDEVFEELVDKFCQVKNIDSHEEILKALWDRETKMSTGIKKGIAIPHGKTSCMDKVQGILGISKKGIEYDALDGQPVYLIFMVIVPKTDSEEHLHLLKRLSGLLGNHQFYAELIIQNDPYSANRIIEKFENIYITSD